MNITKHISTGKKHALFAKKEVTGEGEIIGNEAYYKISNVDAMRPFFMSIVSNSNHWMFLSSNGGITAGRKNSNMALFPYYTDDKIIESSEVTGSKTLLKIIENNTVRLWEPFTPFYKRMYAISQNLYKNSFGNKIIFEEINHDLELVFRYEWNSSDQFGFVKKATLKNLASYSRTIEVLDGLQNILPCGVGEDLQRASSNLVDAYKRSELHKELGIGVYALSAIIVDKAEPSEALKANTVWSLGIDNPTYLLSSLQLENFRNGFEIVEEYDVKGERGAYFTHFTLELFENAEQKWYTIAEVNQTVSKLNQLKQFLTLNTDIESILESDIEAGTNHLVQLVASADGLQATEDKLRTIRHFSNVMFNNMRGGVFDNNYDIDKKDFVQYIAKANKKVFKKKQEVLQQLPAKFEVSYLKEIASKSEDKNFRRLCFEYLPLKFSRRHGDPSRPWNKFSINTKNESDGSKILDYEGNWRDIFQNWEALAHSYPEFIEGMIYKFLNATTFEGYNPYRVMKDGFDWETIEPDNPWSYIGYWGDHQIIYLLKFLEFAEQYYPGKLEGYFTKDLFVYANVPYRIKSYQELLKDSKNTIEFDEHEHDRILQKKSELGADGALLRDENYFIYKVNFIEKILATVLAKVSNFIPEAGIWMNTQRPEWNDANNALVGNGVSMVTLYYLRRFLKFFENLISKSDFKEANISEELAVFFNKVHNTFNTYKDVLKGKISDKARKEILDNLGEAASEFRLQVYQNNFTSDQEKVTKEELVNFITTVLQFTDHTIQANKREDKLYHAYNLMTIENENEISISYLPEMLEGQVAVLSSGYLTTVESLEVLDALKASSLFRPDQYSYILYPNKELDGFFAKNNIDKKEVQKSELLLTLLEHGNGEIIEQDCYGDYHFNGNFNNQNSLKEALANLPEEYHELVINESKSLLGLFEKVFNHKEFTGRSGTFYGYEGLGSIYWHMVSKLLLAVQEVTWKAIKNQEDESYIGRLFDHYFEINEGLGVNKSPELYGAIPTDAYSHTPYSKGAQQPGMTGQVKEDIICRQAEIGVLVENGEILFNPRMLRKQEFLKEQTTFRYVDVAGQTQEIELKENSMCFTYCQIPIVYQMDKKTAICVIYNDNKKEVYGGQQLNKETSQKVFKRSGEIKQIIVSIIK